MVEIAIAEARKQKGLTQIELAKKTGLSQQMICKFELGKTIPRVDQMVSIIQAIGCEWDDVVKL